MVSLYHALFFPAIINGLFLAIVTRTGIDISPTGIGLMIFGVLQPYVNEQNILIFRIVEFILFFLPWISLVIVVIRFGVKGLIIYGIIIMVSYGLVLYVWK